MMPVPPLHPPASNRRTWLFVAVFLVAAVVAAAALLVSLRAGPD